MQQDFGIHTNTNQCCRILSQSHQRQHPSSHLWVNFDFSTLCQANLCITATLNWSRVWCSTRVGVELDTNTALTLVEHETNTCRYMFIYFYLLMSVLCLIYVFVS